MNENNKTITTKLTHDIIKKDFFALHMNYLKIVEVFLCCLFVAFAFTLWIWTLSLESKTLAIVYGIPVVLATLLVIYFIIKLVKQSLCILSGKYKVITDYVTNQEDKYTIMAKHLLKRRHNGLLTRKTHKLVFGKQSSFRLEKHTYYHWSPMFELDDDQIFEHAQRGAKYHLIMVGKNIVMIYNAETFLLK